MQASVAVSVTDSSSEVPVKSLVVGGYDVRVSHHYRIVPVMIFILSISVIFCHIVFVPVMIFTRPEHHYHSVFVPVMIFTLSITVFVPV